MHLTFTSFVTYQDQDAVMGTVWRELRGSAGFLDPGCVSGEPVHQRATGRPDTLGGRSKNALRALGICFHMKTHTIMSAHRIFSKCQVSKPN